MNKMMWGAVILAAAVLPAAGQRVRMADESSPKGSIKATASASAVAASVLTDANSHFSAARDFSFVSNPNRTWSYGYTTSVGSPFSLYQISGSTVFSGEQGWFGPIPGPTAPGFPLVVAEPNGIPDVLDMGPGPSSYTVVRWTAPSNGRWDVVGEFFGTGLTTGDVHVLRNGRAVFDSPLNGSAEEQFFRVVSLKKDATVDFAAGPGTDGNNDFDSTGFRATIAPHLFDFTTIDFPGASSTRLFGINARDEAVGDYIDSAGNNHGFLLKAGVFISIDPAGALLTQARGINDAGTITGFFEDQTGGLHGFVLQDGAFTLLDVPGAVHSQGLGINNHGDVAGAYDLGDVNTSIAFVFANGTFTTFEVPGSAPSTTAAFGLNDRDDTVGIYSDAQGSSHGFLRRSSGIYQAIDFSPATDTLVTGINGGGRIVGNYFPGDGTGTHGLVFSRGGYSSVDFPALMSRTRIRGISEKGALAGFYSTDGVTTHAFLAKPED
jgi:hypothetical protein